MQEECVVLPIVKNVWIWYNDNWKAEKHKSAVVRLTISTVRHII